MKNELLKIYEIEGVENLKNWFNTCRNIYGGKTFEEFTRSHEFTRMIEGHEYGKKFLLSGDYELIDVFTIRENEFSGIEGKYYSYIDSCVTYLHDIKRDFYYYLPRNNGKTEKLYRKTDYKLLDKLRYFKVSGISEPNKIGKPTLKALENWGNYYYEVRKQENEYMRIANEKRADFIAKLEGLPVVWVSENQGYISDNVFKYSFTILENGSIQEGWEKILYAENDLNGFLKYYNK